MKVFKQLSILLFVSIILCTYSCKTDPIVPDDDSGDPITEDSSDIEIISIIESNVCEDNVISFQAQVLPILVSNCAYEGCHSSEDHEDGVIMDNYTKAKKEVEPGDPGDSELYEVITEDPDDNDIMPPNPADVLTDEQIAVIELWIDQGADNTDCNLPCNSEETSFATNVFPLLKDQCYGCHHAEVTEGGINLEDYDHILPYAQNGKLLGSIKFDAGFDAMPPLGNKMTDCQIAMIENWIVEGVQDN